MTSIYQRLVDAWEAPRPSVAGPQKPFGIDFAHGLFVVVLAAVLALPCVLVGMPPGYDSEYHVAYQYQFSRQFWSGDLYPHWLMGANKGFGSPIFLIQYPLPYFVAALLRPVVGFPAGELLEARELGLLCFLAFVAAGLFARLWLRKRCSPSAATIGAVLYISLPYLLGQSLYLRTGLGELCAFVWMPLALAVCEARLLGLKAIAALALVWALLLLSHLTSALLFLPLLMAYVAVTGEPTLSDSVRRLAAAGLAVVLGIGLAGVYFVPFVAYRDLFDLDAMRVLVPPFELGRWFAHVPSSSLGRSMVVPAIGGTIVFVIAAAFQVWRARIGIVGRACMILSLVLGTVVLIPDVGAFLIRGSGLTVSSYETAGDFPVRMLITSLMTVALVYVACCYLGASSRLAKLLMAAVFVSFLMTLPWSAPLWRVHALTNFQFPWRFGSILTIAAVALYAMAMDKLIRERSSQNWRSVWILSCAAFMVVVVGMFAWRVQMRFTHPSTVDQALVRNVDNMYRSYVPGDQVAGFARLIKSNEETFDVVSTPIDEYVRGEAVRSEIASGRCSAKVTPTRPESMAVSAECQEDTVLRIGQLYSPLWQVIPTSDRSLRQVLQSSNDGLIEVALPRGMHDFEITFDLGATLRTGIIVTLLSAAMAAIAALAGHFGLFEGRRK